jgi:hypothetical protein
MDVVFVLNQEIIGIYLSFGITEDEGRIYLFFQRPLKMKKTFDG